MHHELWFTALLNQFLAGPANAARNLVGLHAHDPAKPWENWMAMQLIILLLLVVLAPLVRNRLSMDRPGWLQQTFEMIYEFLGGISRDVVGHGWKKDVAWFGTLFLFILLSNLLGVIPTFESPTMSYAVPAGAALATFFYYQVRGVQEQGLWGHIKHFLGPMWVLAWFIGPLELISHCIRPLSLTIRLYANMLAGEQVTISFLGIVPLLIPVVFMGLHVFVSFVQSFIFTMLSMVYVGEAVAHEDH